MKTILVSSSYIFMNSAHEMPSRMGKEESRHDSGKPALLLSSSGTGGKSHYQSEPVSSSITYMSLRGRIEGKSRCRVLDSFDC